MPQKVIFMSKKLLIDARQADETRVVLLNANVIEDVDYEISHRKQLKGNIYLAKVTRVEPSLQAAFVEYGGNRQGFLAFSEIHPDYYRIPVEDREKILAEQSESSDGNGSVNGSGNGSDKDADKDAEADAGSDEDASNSADDNSDDNADDTESLNADNDADNGADFDADDERERKRRFDKFRKHYSIQEVISRRQILLVQVVKEERGNKGAALTTYMSLAGRYCVLMPNTYHNGGVSRKISDPADRKKLKTIVNGLNVPSGMAVIVRTAGSKRTKAEITRDYNYLLRQWNDIREKTLESSAPTIIHEEGNLIKRSIRDYYTSEIEEVIVEGDYGYKAARAHMKNLMPTHVKKIKQYKDEVNHLFQAHHVENMIAAMYEPEVTLKSGGYIVINQTEALVAIDVNSGKATRERNIEETALKTNVEAAVEIARQLKLRDLSGLVVIDFIDMEVTRNKNTVERKLKEALKADRARVQIGSISQFGLLEMSRQRLRPSLSEAVSDICPHCHGTGRIRSVESAALAIIHQIEAEVARKSRKKLTVAMAAEVALYILNHKRDMILDLETRYDLIIVLDQDNSLLPPDIRFDGISEKQEQPERKKAKPEPASNGAATHPEAALSDDDEENKPKRRRRRGKRGGRRRNRRDEDTADTAVAENNNGEANVASGAASNDTANDDAANGDAANGDTANGDASSKKDADANQAEKPAKTGRSRRRKPAAKADADNGVTEAAAETSTDAADADSVAGNSNDASAEKPAKPSSRRRPASRKKASEADSSDKVADSPAPETVDSSGDDATADKPAPKRGRRKKAESLSEAASASLATGTDEADKVTGDAPKPAKPKRAPRKKKAASAETSSADTIATATTTDNATSDSRANESSAEIQVVDVNTVSGESKKKGWWSR